MLANCESLSQPVASYIPDDEQGQYDAVKALLAAGYRRPLCLHLPASQPATIRRRRGLERACREAGIEPDHLSHSYMGQGDEHYHDIPAVVLAHIREGKPGFDSVICGNDRMRVYGLSDAAGPGVRIPQDVAVVGYDNMVGIGDLFLPPLSTVQLPHYDIGAPERPAYHSRRQPSGDAQSRQPVVAARLTLTITDVAQLLARHQVALNVLEGDILGFRISQKVMPIKATLSAV
ncbi:sugar-binding domain protein [Klebsiella pneumoniae]|uniref:Sugar-binding domain protein n=1 Tax=Klebsiella pneumoniae TaxID=573 RepID=A0A4P0YFG6_KLEPN|nr:sugar-binding domain protein [Klebsiella pneumoniae]